MSATDQPKSVVSGFTGPEMDAAAQARWPKDGQMLERNAFREGAYWAAEALAAAPLPQAGELWAVGSWLSAALDDPKVCAEMKADINAWFEGGGHVRQSLAQPAPAPQVDLGSNRKGDLPTEQATDGCSSNEAECPACDGSGKIVEAATTTGANQHSACQHDCEDCDGSGRILPQTEKGS